MGWEVTRTLCTLIVALKGLGRGRRNRSSFRRLLLTGAWLWVYETTIIIKMRTNQIGSAPSRVMKFSCYENYYSQSEYPLIIHFLARDIAFEISLAVIFLASASLFSLAVISPFEAARLYHW